MPGKRHARHPRDDNYSYNLHRCYRCQTAVKAHQTTRCNTSLRAHNHVVTGIRRRHQQERTVTARGDVCTPWMHTPDRTCESVLAIVINTAVNALFNSPVLLLSYRATSSEHSGSKFASDSLLMMPCTRRRSLTYSALLSSIVSRRSRAVRSAAVTSILPPYRDAARRRAAAAA